MKIVGIIRDNQLKIAKVNGGILLTYGEQEEGYILLEDDEVSFLLSEDGEYIKLE